MADNNRMVRLAAGAAFLALYAASLDMPVRFFIGGHYMTATAWGALTLLFVYVLFRIMRPGREDYAGGMEPDEHYTELVSTKDTIKAEMAKGILDQAGVNYVSLDEHSSHLMNYLPDVRVRIMVPAGDMERAVEAVRDLFDDEDGA